LSRDTVGAVVAPSIPGVPRRGGALRVIAPVVVMIALITTPLAYCLWPRGEKIGSIDLTSKDPSLPVTLTAGTRLVFRLDFAPNTKVVARRLRESTIMVEIVDGAPTEKATCPAYEGSSMTGLSGIPLSCELRIARSGPVRLRAKGQWHSELEPESAMLEVRQAH
jgi:hypothetical protein